MTDTAAADFTDHIAKVKKENLIKAISTSKYFSLLTDSSTDSAVIEEEVLYLLFLNEGKPEINFFWYQNSFTHYRRGTKRSYIICI